jgi:two-component system, chemotaxis family, chemotaxis protein CheY
MIVDDNQGIREVIKNVLGSTNAEFVECEDGGEAVSRYSQESPDWVLMDLSMEYIDGISAASELQSMYAEAKIIIVTDYGDALLRAKAKEAGAYAYVLKENLHELPVILNSILK